MSDDKQKSDHSDGLANAVRKAYEAKLEGVAPDFDATWNAAQTRFQGRKRRYRLVSAVAASIVIFSIVLNFLLPGQSQDPADSELAAMMMVSIQWEAPSDSLLPEYDFDIYQDLPEIINTTDLTRGLLL